MLKLQHKLCSEGEAAAWEHLSSILLANYLPGTSSQVHNSIQPALYFAAGDSFFKA